MLFGFLGPTLISTDTPTSTGFTCNTYQCIGYGYTDTLFRQLQTLLNDAIVQYNGGSYKFAVTGVIDSNTVYAVDILAQSGLPLFTFVDAQITNQWVAANASALIKALSVFLGLNISLISAFQNASAIRSSTSGTITTAVASTDPTTTVPQDPQGLPTTVVPQDPSNLPPQGSTFDPTTMITDTLGVTCHQFELSGGYCFGGPSVVPNSSSSSAGPTMTVTTPVPMMPAPSHTKWWLIGAVGVVAGAILLHRY